MKFHTVISSMLCLNFDILFGNQVDSEQLLHVMNSIEKVYQFAILKSIAILEISFLILRELSCGF